MSSIKDKILSAIKAKTALTEKGLVELLGSKDEVHRRVWDLVKEGTLTKSEDGVYKFAEGVDTAAILNVELEELKPLKETTSPDKDKESSKDKDKDTKDDEVEKNELGIPLDPRYKFMDLLKRVVVKPDSIIPTLTEAVFNGDIDSLKWLDNVVLQQARGYITNTQHRLIRNYWANPRNLPYNPNEFDEEETPKSKRKSGKDGSVELSDDEDEDWGIRKDKSGEWVAVPGIGHWTQEMAESKAAKRQALQAFFKGDDGEAVESGKKEKDKSGGSSDILFERMIEFMFDQMGDKGDNKEVALLRKEIAQLRDAQDREWKQSMEARMVDILNQTNRDPFEQYELMKRKRQELGLDKPTVTYSSPAVQMIKDVGDKADKQLERLIGLGERFFIREGVEYKPEETRSPQAREQKANELLGTVQDREKSRQIRRAAFDI